MIRCKFEKIQFLAIFFIYLFIPFNPLRSNESKDYLVIDMLVMRCYKDVKACKQALNKINDYQKNAAIKKMFSCQTRLLGLEANLIMAMDSKYKGKEAKSIIDAIKKYC